MKWDTLSMFTAVCGFIFICMIWWMYFDSFPLLIESKRDIDGDAILYSQLSTYISFAILANMIRHAILNDLSIDDFRIMVVVGVLLFYLGKQTAYFFNRPEYRPYILLNTVAMLVIACGGEGMRTLDLDFAGVEPLANDYHYEGWAIINGEARSTGKFNLDAAGDFFTVGGVEIPNGEFDVD